MNDKLAKILNEINISNEDQHFFLTSILEKVIVYDNNKMWEFIISVDKMIPYSVYKTLHNGLVTRFSQVEEIKITIINKTNDTTYLEEYYKNIIDNLVSKDKKIISMRDSEINIEDNMINIEALSTNEFNNFNKVKIQIENKLRDYGFSNVIIAITLNKDGDLEIKKKINEETESVNLNLKEYDKKIVLDSPPKPKYRPKRDETIIPISEILYELDNISIKGAIFGMEVFETKSGYKIITLKVTDNKDSIVVKMFTRSDEELKLINEEIKVGSWYTFYGKSQRDNFANGEIVFMTRYNEIRKVEDIKEEIPEDTCEEKRIELHAHTFMSQMDGLVSVEALMKRAAKYGHKAIAITDHNCAHSFPDAYKKHPKDLKIIYGAELGLIDDVVDICFRENDTILLDNTYVVFDFETTGFNAGGGDSIIEIGAVKINNGEIIDTFSKLVNPGKKLSLKIIEITHITDEMLEGKEDEETAIKEFIKWTGDLPMVAHNAKFDMSFLNMCYSKYNLGEYTNPVIDTLELSRVINTDMARHNLTALVKKYDVPWDEDAHHRADYDAKGTALVFHKMLKNLSNKNIELMSDLNKMVSKEELHTLGNVYHFNVLVKNRVGLKNLFKILSYASTKYFYKNPRILRSELNNLREGLLIGSCCYNSEVFTLARSKTDEELANIISFYDYIEVQPVEVYDHLIQNGDFENKYELISQIEKIIRVAEEAGKIVVATGDVHHLDRKDKIYREIIVNQKIPGGGRHPLNKKSITSIPSQHLRTTNEMYEDFNFLSKEKAKEIIVTNPNIICDMIEDYEVIIDTKGIPFSPKMTDSDKIVKDMVYEKAHELYGEKLPVLIEERLEKELNGIIGGGFDVIYLIAQKLVKKSNDDGYFVGSRGSVGSSLVAYMMGISEVNPLPAHYVCPKCSLTFFDDDGHKYALDYPSGYDLPNKNCPKCDILMNKDGQDMPFETFLGFNADKVPDIDLNFSSEYQSKAHDYTKELFGEKNAFRAGTVGTVAEKTAYGYVKGYYEDNGLETPKSIEIERIALGCTGVKRTTGQHPGGIVVVPDYMEIFDFTSYQYPADDPSSKWYTTHFEYHAIEEDLLKLDILGHDDPTMLKYLTDLSGMRIEDIPMDDEKVISLFSSPEALGVTEEQIMCPTGSIGLPETGTRFVIGLLSQTKPKTFGELVKISGLSHGTDVWANNAEELVKNNIVPFKEVIGCRDDIMVYLSNHGLKPIDAFKIMELVRKGQQRKRADDWKGFMELMKEKGIADWYIESCNRIKYMFPKAHATAYCMMCCRVAWFKVHQPINYYSAYFSIRCFDFDIEVMQKGYDAVKAKIVELNNKGRERSNKEDAIIDVLSSTLEMICRGFAFKNINLYKSHYKNFIIDEDGKSLIPPFRSIDGLGDTVASNIYEEAKKNPFISIEDFSRRCKVSSSLVEKMRLMGVLDNMPETSQLSLF